MNETLIQINSDVDNKTIGYGVHELVGFPVSGDSDFTVHDGLYSTRIHIEKYEAILYIDERVALSVKKFPNIVHRFFAKILLGWSYAKTNM